jgi:hypothetical protein
MSRSNPTLKCYSFRRRPTGKAFSCAPVSVPCSCDFEKDRERKSTLVTLRIWIPEIWPERFLSDLILANSDKYWAVKRCGIRHKKWFPQGVGIVSLKFQILWRGGDGFYRHRDYVIRQIDLIAPGTRTITKMQWHRLRIVVPFLCPYFIWPFERANCVKPHFSHLLTLICQNRRLKYIWLIENELCEWLFFQKRDVNCAQMNSLW